MPKLPEGTLVVVADGEKARWFRNVGDDNALQLRQEALMDAHDMFLQGPSGAAPPEQTQPKPGGGIRERVRDRASRSATLCPAC